MERIHMKTVFVLLALLASLPAFAQPGQAPTVRVETAAVRSLSSTTLVPGTVISRHDANPDPLDAADVGNQRKSFDANRVKVRTREGKDVYYDATLNTDGTFTYTPITGQAGEQNPLEIEYRGLSACADVLHELTSLPGFPRGYG